MDDAKEEVRARLSIEDVIGEYVQLKRAGRSFKGLSPFTSEKTPSFYVSPDKNIWHDFSSNKGGDVFSFIMEVEGLDFRGSLEHLARKAGVDLSAYQTKGRHAAHRKKELLEVMRLAMAYYQHSLLKNPRALDYVFKKRKFTKQTVGEFRIGYAPDQGNALVQFLAKKGFSKKDIAEAGLSNRFGGDLFRGRMIVPLLDETGQAVGFTGRIIVDDPEAPKYLNTPATLLYDKSRHLFGLSQAKEAIRKTGYSVLTEGNLDVVSSHQAKVKAVVAAAGTALTEHQLRALKRLSPEIRLAFDADKAGIAATERAIPIASSLGVSLKVITLPGTAKDPDELIQQDVKIWQGAIGSAEPAVDWVIRQYGERENLRSAEGKRRFSTAALEVIKGLSDPVEQEHYEHIVAGMIGSSIEAVKAKQTSRAKEDVRSLKPVAPSSKSASQYVFDHIDTALGAGLLYPGLRVLFREYDPNIFQNDKQQAAARFLIKSEKEVSSEPPLELRDIDEYVKVVILRAEKRYDGWREEDMRLEIAELLRRRISEQQIQQIEKDIQSAEDRGDDAEIERLRREHYALIKEVKRG